MPGRLGPNNTQITKTVRTDWSYLEEDIVKLLEHHPGTTCETCSQFPFIPRVLDSKKR